MILVDVHPAQLVDGDGRRHAPVRAVLTHRRLRVWSAAGRECVLLLDEPHGGVTLESRHPQVGRPIRVGLSSGATVELVRQRGCGCGSPLKSLRPPKDDD